MIETEQTILSEQMKDSEEETLHPIDDLSNFGIASQDILKLKQAGICTLKGLTMHTRRNLIKIKGMSETKVDKMKEAVHKFFDSSLTPTTSFMTASQFNCRREQVLKISTGSSDFDTLLNGGIQTMAITEVFGEFRTGKTQLSHTLCVTVQLLNSTYKAAFIDTEGTFRPERLKEIAIRYDLNPEQVLENVIYARAHNSEHQNDLLIHLTNKFIEEPNKFKLLIVDSVISLFRTDFVGRGELGERQQKLNTFLSRLLRISEEYNLAVFITNQMMADPSATLSFVADPKKPIGGHVLAHASTTRIYLRKGRGETRVAKIYDSPDVPEAEAVYAITVGGIDNAVEYRSYGYRGMDVTVGGIDNAVEYSGYGYKGIDVIEGGVKYKSYGYRGMDVIEGGVKDMMGVSI
ncbi:DNA repair and recombination protein Rad51 [Hamiltosporidium tvaerminnensis]|uniref:DNA repair and recombination protein Rad51 n=1 Tax=Hamiltosporidium tvaerminnensis TaxID=1176355 RepID=A0A4Q9LQD5_9MICR|nr:DNA repair and recombination protein Rad51 [Hamiltosporidium tvaerminnensis]